MANKAKKIKGMFDIIKEKFVNIKERVEDARKKLEEEKELKHKLLFHQKENKKSSDNVNSVIDIKFISVLKATIAVMIVLLASLVIGQMGTVLSLLLFALLFAAALNPLVDKLEKSKIPRGLAILLSYIIILAIVVIIVISLFPMVAEQTSKLVAAIINYLKSLTADGKITDLPIPVYGETKTWLINNLNTFKENINFNVLFDQAKVWLETNSDAITSNLQKFGTNFLGVISALANGLGNIIIVFIMTFFLIIDKEQVRSFSLALIPGDYRNYFSKKLDTIQFKIGSWVRGQLFLGLSVGLATWVGLWILYFIGIDIGPYKETLAIIAGITELIPIIGPILAACFAVLVAANVGLGHVIAVVILFTMIQQLENNILVPVIMHNAVGLSPIVIIIAMMIGANFYGLLGLILAIPITTIIVLFIDDFIIKQNYNNKEASS